MKHFIFPFIALAVMLVSCGPTKDEAITFNDELVAMQKSSLNAEKEFYDVCDKLNAEDIKKALQAFKEKIAANIESTNKIKSNKEFDSYKESVLKLHYAYKDLLDKEFGEYAKYYSIPTDQFTDEDQKLSGDLAAKINVLLDPVNQNFVLEQKIFAQKWQLTLVSK